MHSCPIASSSSTSAPENGEGGKGWCMGALSEGFLYHIAVEKHRHPPIVSDLAIDCTSASVLAL